MTVLTPEMIAALAHVAVEKTRYEKVREELEAQHEREFELARKNLTTAVRYAREIGTPIRQIGIQGLSTKDAATVKAFLPAEGEEVAPVQIPQEVRETLTTPGVTELEGNIYIVTEPSGDEWEFWGMELDGKVFFERSDYTDRGVDSEVQTPTAVLATLKKAYPKGDFTAFLEDEED